MNRTSSFLTGLLLTAFTQAQTIVQVGNTPVTIDTVFTGLDVPWEILYGPDGHIWTTERKGIVSRIDPVLKTKNVILDITAQVYQYGESGLLGMILDPDFQQNGHVYLVYTYDPFPITNERLVRYTYTSGQLQNPLTLVDGIKGHSNHDGARLIFLPDKTLVMTTGEAGQDLLAQDPTSLNGKTLRLNRDGSIPGDNPDPTSYIYTSGHRNAQGLAYGPAGNIYLSEHGPVQDDELQILEKGRNYGWPNVVGICNTTEENTFCSGKNVKEPIMYWTPTLAVSDLVYYLNNGIPEFHNKMLMTSLKAKKLTAIGLDVAGTQTVSEAYYFTNMFGRLRDICVGSNHEIYIATNGANAANTDANTHSIIRIQPPLPNSLPETEPDLFSIKPTLADESIKVQSHSAGTFSLAICDLAGKRLLVKNNVERSCEINTAHLVPGVYFITVTSVNNIRVTRKFIKQ